MRQYVLRVALVLAAVAAATVGLAGSGQAAAVNHGGIATAINQFGVIAGWSYNATGVHHAVLWTPQRRIVALGTLLPGERSEANDITSFGTLKVVGFVLKTTTGGSRAVLWSQGRTTDLGTLGGIESEATAISEDGTWVVGTSTTATGLRHAFRWSKHTGMVDLATPDGLESEAKAVNRAGVVVGSTTTPAAGLRASMWPNSNNGEVTDLGTLGGQQSTAHDISQRSSTDAAIVGLSRTATGETHSFRWTRAGGMVDLGTLGGRDSGAFRVNNTGDLVGWSLNAANQFRAVVWKAETRGPIDLFAGQGIDINDRGDVVGWRAGRDVFQAVVRSGRDGRLIDLPSL